ncbi:N-acetylmuramoyl-L-alanine amidase [Paenibacillus ferrarius]|uniref:N-acetylmuramoyl-L-alanine amidase n=1 Tax=Paenibacillus ferrarius TaxID=1469647 RepID=UPI003D2D364D
MKFPAFCLALLVALMLLPTTAFGAEASKPKPVQLFMNEKKLDVSEVVPRIVDGNTLVPVRVIVEEIGAKVGWEEATRKVTIKQDSNTMLLLIDNKTAQFNGKKEQLEVAPFIENDTTMLPLRYIVEKLGVEIKWDEPSYSVHMYKVNEEDAKPVTGPVDLENGSVEVKPPLTGTGNGTVETPSGTGSSNNTSSTGKGSNTGTGDSKGSDGTAPVSGNRTISAITLSETDLTVTAKDGKLVPSVLKLSNPDRIVFDFPNTVLNDTLQKALVKNTGELPSKHPLVEKIRYSNFSSNPATVRIILDLKSTAYYQTQPVVTAGTWRALIGDKPFQNVPAVPGDHLLTVVIDAGHGDTDPGALSITGRHEKDFTLSTAKKVAEELAKDKRVQVLMTRSDDTFIPLDDRVSFANEAPADLFLSIHGNSAKATVSGTETYYNRPESIPFANVIHQYAVAATGFPDRRVREADYRVITKTAMPAVLLEVGYLSNKNDETAMYTEAFQDKLALALVNAIKDYLKLK